MSDTESTDKKIDKWAIGQALNDLHFQKDSVRKCAAINDLLDRAEREQFKDAKARTGEWREIAVHGLPTEAYEGELVSYCLATYRCPAFGNEPCVSTALYSFAGKYWSVDDAEVDREMVVDAWMPLPPPFTGTRSEGETEVKR